MTFDQAIEHLNRGPVTASEQSRLIADHAPYYASAQVIVDSYRIATFEERGAIVGALEFLACARLIAFARRQVAVALQQRSDKPIRLGLAAAAVGGHRLEDRDRLTSLYLLYRSARRLNLDVNRLFAEAASLIRQDRYPEFAEQFRRFPSSSPELRFEPMAEDGSFMNSGISSDKRPGIPRRFWRWIVGKAMIGAFWAD